MKRLTALLFTLLILPACLLGAAMQRVDSPDDFQWVSPLKYALKALAPERQANGDTGVIVFVSVVIWAAVAVAAFFIVSIF